MKKLIYYGPYIPIIGGFIPLMTFDCCIYDESYHFTAAAIWQALCWVAVVIIPVFL